MTQHTIDVQPVYFVSPVDPEQRRRVAGHQPTCSCGWEGLVWNHGSRVRAAIADAHTEGRIHQMKEEQS